MPWEELRSEERSHVTVSYIKDALKKHTCTVARKYAEVHHPKELKALDEIKKEKVLLKKKKKVEGGGDDKQGGGSDEGGNEQLVKGTGKQGSGSDEDGREQQENKTDNVSTEDGVMETADNDNPLNNSSISVDEY